MKFQLPFPKERNSCKLKNCMFLTHKNCLLVVVKNKFGGNPNLVYRCDRWKMLRSYLSRSFLRLRLFYTQGVKGDMPYILGNWWLQKCFWCGHNFLTCVWLERLNLKGQDHDTRKEIYVVFILKFFPGKRKKNIFNE